MGNVKIAENPTQKKFLDLLKNIDFKISIF